MFGGILDITHEKNDVLCFNLNSCEWKVLDYDSLEKQKNQNENNYLPPIQTKFNKSKININKLD